MDDFEEVYQLTLIAFGQDNEGKLVNLLRNNPTVFVPELSIVGTPNLSPVFWKVSDSLSLILNTCLRKSIE